MQAVEALGWVNKAWVAKNGNTGGGRPFDKTTLYRLLTSKTYLGLITHKDQVYPGEHPALVDKVLWEKVQAVLGRNGKTAGAAVRNRYGALLKGILNCSCCDCSMVHTYTAKDGRRYRYYVCLSAQKKGWDTCATRSLPAAEIEAFVAGQIQAAGRDPAVLAGTLRKMAEQNEKAIADLKAEEKALARQLPRHHAAVRKAVDRPAVLADLTEQVRLAEQKLTQIGNEILRLQVERVDTAEVSAALSSFAPVWEQLSPKEQARVISLLVEKVEYDGAAGTVAVTFRPAGIKTLAVEQGHEVAA